MIPPRKKRPVVRRVITATAVLALLAIIVVGTIAIFSGNSSADDASRKDDGKQMTITQEDGTKKSVTVIGTATEVTIPEVGVCTYEAYNALPNSFEFGAPLGGFKTANEAANAFAKALGSDCLLAGIWLTVEEQGSTPSAIAAFEAGQKPFDFDEKGAREKAQTFKNDPAAWKQAITGFFERNQDISLVDMPGVRYWSLGQEPGATPSDMPGVTLLSEQQDMGQTIVLRHYDGKPGSEKKDWVGNGVRVKCHFQPGLPFKPGVQKVSYVPRGGPPPPVTQITTHRPPPPVCTSCECLHNCPPPPPPVETCPNGQPIPPNGLCEKEPTTAPGNGGPGDGGSGMYGGGPRPTTPKPETTWTPRPDTYTPPPSPVETTAPPAPQVTVTSTPPSAQPTVAPSSQPEVTQEITGCTPEIC